MGKKKEIFVIVGSANRNSTNQKIVEYLSDIACDNSDWRIFNDLKALPHFDPELTNNPPQEIIALRKNIEKADAVLICTPEYVFSIPSGLKNIIEWCVSTTVFSNKPTGLITASASGLKGHEELKLIMNTLMAKFTNDTTLIIQGIKGKINAQGQIVDPKTLSELLEFMKKFEDLVGYNKDHIQCS